MNKIFLSLLLAVCVLGMVLIMLNERLRKPDQAPALTTITEPAASVETPLPPLTTASEDKNTAPAVSPSPVPTIQTPVRDILPETPAKHDEPAVPMGVAPVPQPSEPPAPAKTESTSVPVPKPETRAVPVATSKPEKPAAQPAPSVSQPAPSNVVQQDTKKNSEQQSVVTKFVVFARDKGATVRLVASAPISYKSMELVNPNRMVVDLEGEWKIKAPGVPKNAVVTNVRLGKEGKKTRIVIDLSQKARSKFILSQDRMSLDIRLDQ